MKAAAFFHLGGDIDILAPIIAAGARDGVDWRIIVAAPLHKNNRRLPIVMRALDIAPDVFIEMEAGAGELRAALSGCRALITSSETTLRPHRLAHALTRTANELGVATFTLQHGVENVGLTYFDDRQGTDVLFASRHVLTWAGQANLPEVVDPDTRAKVRDAGYAPPDISIFDEARRALQFDAGGTPVVGVFENLHWTRFSDRYRERFLADLQAVIDAEKETLFLLKPHPEGRWLTERFGGARPEGDNLRLVDPRDPAWGLLTAPTLMPLLSGVITTPSKVALDAVVAGVPAAIASYDGAYEAYRGLQTLQDIDDWRSFVDACGAQRSARASDQAFLAQTVSSLDGAVRTVDLMKSLSGAK